MKSTLPSSWGRDKGRGKEENVKYYLGIDVGS
ncbi:unnamed protein product, partial [marine sediment metagenome]